VEPKTNYFVGRVQQDFREGETQLGTIFTAVNRNINQVYLDHLTREAYALGVDFRTHFRNRDYSLDANMVGSRIAGSPEAMTQAQTASSRYFQRPDNQSAHLDEHRTSLNGQGGSIRFTRTSNHDLRFQTGVAWRSPGFEINDVGFMRNADEINQFTWVGFRRRDPIGVFDRFEINGNEWLDWDTAGNFLKTRANMNANAQFRNKSQAGFGFTKTFDYVSNTQLRGGPASKWPGNWNASFWSQTDHRKKVYFRLEGEYEKGNSDSGNRSRFSVEASCRPSNAMVLSFESAFSRYRPQMQYIDQFAYQAQDRYLFGRLDQKTTILTIRMDYAVTPNLTIQYYGSPFMSQARFDEFKRITDPQAQSYRDRFEVFESPFIGYDADNAIYRVDENQDGVEDYSFDDPDFDFREFRSNLVVRWEYQPGSALFYVWSQSRADEQVMGQNTNTNDALSQLFSSHPDNIIMIKFSKWFSP